jgi:hypothetical protein
VLEWIHIVECLVEDFVEDVRESTSAHELTSSLLDELAFYEFLKASSEFSYHIEDQLALVLVIVLEQLQSLKFFLFLEQHSCYL